MTAEATDTVLDVQMPRSADVAITFHRGRDDRGAPTWRARVMSEGFDRRQEDYEADPDALMNWLVRTVMFAMGRVAATQERKDQQQ